MGKLVALGWLVIGLLIAALFAALALATRPADADPYALALAGQQAAATQTALALAQAAAVADATRGQAEAATLAPLVLLVKALALVAGATFAGALAVAGCARVWASRRPLVQLPAVAMPVPRADLEAGHYRQLPAALIEARIQQAIAAGPQVPSSYSPHITYQHRQEVGPVPAVNVATSAFQAPSIGEAAERGAFRDGRYILGYRVSDGQPVTLDQDQGRSLLIAGQGGSGGTTALLASALQEILMPFYLPGQQEAARFIVVDYHARKPQGLLQRIGDELGDRILYAAHKPQEVQRAVQMFEAECRARVDGAASPYPLILLCDEVGNMIDDADYDGVMPGLLAAFKHANNAYRAVGGKAIVRGHTLQASAWGNSATIRQSFHARAGMRLDEGAGVLLGLKPAVARTLLALPAGQSYVTGPGLPPTHVVSSNVRRGDIGAVLDLAGVRHRAVYVAAAEGAGSDGRDDPGRVITGRFTTVEDASEAASPASEAASTSDRGASTGGSDGKRERVRQLVKQGVKSSAIIAEVWGATGGRSYQQAADELTAILAELVS